jgi:hypothetical protein
MTDTLRVLIVEDNPNDAELMLRDLRCAQNAKRPRQR